MTQTLTPSGFRANVPGGSPGCATCGGLGYRETADHRIKPCVCVLRRRAINYLTPTFAGELWVKPADGFDTTFLDGRNVFIQNHKKAPDISFNRIFHIAVKSFLLNHGMKLSFHNCLGGKELVDCAFPSDEEERNRYQRMENVDLLLLYLAGDPPNKTYSQTMTSLLRHRTIRSKATWVATPYSLIPDDGYLDQVYGRDFVSYIKPKQKNDMPGGSAGHFLLFDPTPITRALTSVKAA